MIQIVPNILTDNLKEVKEKLNRLSGISRYIHIDVLDGEFVANKTVALSELKKIKNLAKFKIFLHLMVKKPLDYIFEASQLKVETCIAQIESCFNLRKYIRQVKAKGMKVGVALDYGSKLVDVDKKLFPYLDFILIMAIKAGWSGQQFRKERLGEVRKLRLLKEKQKYHFKIGMDGGINKDTIKSCVKAGSEVFFTHSAIWKSKNVRKALLELKALAECA